MCCNRRSAEFVANRLQVGLALFAEIVVDADLDQFMAVETVRDFAHDGLAETVLGDRNDRVETVGTGAQGAALF